jgi:hypothetical protein
MVIAYSYDDNNNTTYIGYHPNSSWIKQEFDDNSNKNSIL